MKILEKVKMLVAALAVAVLPMLALAPTVDAAKVFCPNGEEATDGNLASCTGLEDHAEDGDLMEILSGIINVIIGVVGFVAVVVVILGGVQYTTSAGDAGKVKKAKDTIMYGVIGLVVAILAFAIVNFVLQAFIEK